MSQRLGGKDCGGYNTRTPCLGRDLDKAGARIPCEHNGFLGVPLAQVVDYGRSALRHTSAELKPRYDGRKGPAMWKAPALKVDGAPFKPSNATSGVPIGSLLSWTEKGVRRSGQVWAASWKKAGAVWVAPDDGGSAVALCTKTLDLLP